MEKDYSPKRTSKDVVCVICGRSISSDELTYKIGFKGGGCAYVHNTCWRYKEKGDFKNDSN